MDGGKIQKKRAFLISDLFSCYDQVFAGKFFYSSSIHRFSSMHLIFYATMFFRCLFPPAVSP